MTLAISQAIGSFYKQVISTLYVNAVDKFAAISPWFDSKNIQSKEPCLSITSTTSMQLTERLSEHIWTSTVTI